MVDRIGGALGQQWLQRLIDEAVKQAKPTDRREGAPASLGARLAGLGVTPESAMTGANAGTMGVLGGLGQVAGALTTPAPTSLLPGQGGALGAAIGGADAITGGGASRLGEAIGGLFGGGRAVPAALPPSITNSAANSLVGSGGAGPLGATPGGAAAGALAPSTSAPVSVTDPVRAPGFAGPGGGTGSPATGRPGAASGAAGVGGIAPGGVGAPGSLLDGGFGSGLAQEQTIAELLDNPAFAVQDMLRDRGINPSRNTYAAGILNKYKDIFGALSGLAMGQAGIGPTSSAADTATAYNTFLNNFMGGKIDKGELLRTAMAQAEADPSGVMASLIRDIGPAGMAQLIAGMGGQGRMLGQAQERMLNERALEARRKRQALMETNPEAGVTEDDLSYLQSFRGAI